MNSERTTPSSTSERPRLHGVDWAVRAGAADEVMLGTRRRVRQRRQRRLALAGFAGALALGALAWWQRLPRDAARGALVATTAPSAVIEAPARQVLTDGSVVELKDGAEIAVVYSSEARRVALVRGEAHFQVVKDPARPFIVAVDAVEVRAVGTSFAVQRHPHQVEVLVTTGRVAVDRAADEASGSPLPVAETLALLDAGHRTLVEAAPQDEAPVVETISAAELHQRLAWRQPRLEFTRTPLAEAIPMINRHSALKLSLADPALGEVRISGLLRVDNIETLLPLLELEHGIKAERRGASIVLRPGR